MARVWAERIVDVKLFHYLDSTHQGTLRTDRYRTQALQLTARLRWTLWTVLALASTAAEVWGLLLMTETGISGPGVRRSARPHSLRPDADEPDSGGLTCQHCGHQEPVDGDGYLRMRQHECRT